MKHIYSRILKVVILAAIFIFPQTAIWAENLISPANYLVEVGRDELAQGKVDNAINDFKKALLADPYNAQAMEELKNLGLPDERFQGTKSASQKLRAYQEKVAQLESDKKDMEDRLAKVQMQEDRLNEIYLVRNLELEVLINKVASLRELRMKDQKKQLKQIHQVAEFYSDKNKELKDTVEKQKNTIVNQEVALLMPNERKGVDEAKIEDDLLNLGYRVNQLDPMTQAKMEVQEKLIKTFSEYLELREGRFFEVENNLVFNEIDKAKQEKMLVKKMDEIIKLQDNVDRYLNRLQDRDDLIVDQNKEKELLQSELLNAQQQLDEQNQKFHELEQKYNAHESNAENL